MRVPCVAIGSVGCSGMRPISDHVGLRSETYRQTSSESCRSRRSVIAPMPGTTSRTCSVVSIARTICASLSGWRESNPHADFGGVVCYHYSTPARDSMLRDAPRDRPAIELPHPSALFEVDEVRERLGEREPLLVR